jgi:hypothetical protein
MDRKRSRRAGSAAAVDPSVGVLAGAPVFSGCDLSTLQRIAALGTEVRRGPGSVVQRPGTTLRQAFVVLEGVLAERPAHGRERAVSAGHVVGEDALTRVRGVARTHVTTTTDVRLLVFGPAELGEVAELLRLRREPATRRVERSVLEPAWGAARPAFA